MGLFSTSLSAKDAAGLGTLVADITHSQSPLEMGIEILADEVPSFRLRRFLLGVSQRLKNGEPVETIVTDPQIPAHLRGLFAAGLRSNTLPLVLGEYIASVELHQTLRRQIIGRVAYPILLMAFALGVVWFLLLVIVPTFKSIFADFGIDLPEVTLLTIVISDFLTKVFPQLFNLIFVFLAILLLFAILPLGRKALAQVPLLGGIIKRISASRFFRLLSIFVSHGIPTPLALRLTADATTGSIYRNHALDLARKAEEGMPLGESIESSPAPLKGTAPFVSWAEHHNALGSALDTIADIFAERAKSSGQIITSILPPILYAGMLAMIGVITMALFFPLIKLLTELGK